MTLLISTVLQCPNGDTHLGQKDILQRASLLDELLVQVGIADEEVLELSAVGCVCHFDILGGG